MITSSFTPPPPPLLLPPPPPATGGGLVPLLPRPLWWFAEEDDQELLGARSPRSAPVGLRRAPGGSRVERGVSQPVLLGEAAAAGCGHSGDWAPPRLLRCCLLRFVPEGEVVEERP